MVVIASNLTEKLVEVERWKVALASDLRCIHYFNTPPSADEEASLSDRTLVRENGEALSEDSY